MQGESVEAMLIAPDDLEIHPVAQREYKEARARKIAASWSDVQVGLIHVVVWMGQFLVVDGQHRVSGAKMAGHGANKLECRVYRGLPKPRHSELFLAMQENRAAVKAIDRHLQGSLAEYPVESEIDVVIGGFGLTVGRNKRDGTIVAVEALRQIHGKSPDLLRKTILAVKAAYGLTSSAYDAPLLRGVATFLSRNPEAKPELLGKRMLKDGTPEHIMSRIKALKLFSRDLDGAAETVLKGVYNAGVKQDKRIA